MVTCRNEVNGQLSRFGSPASAGSIRCQSTGLLILSLPPSLPAMSEIILERIANRSLDMFESSGIALPAGQTDGPYAKYFWRYEAG